MRCFWVSDSRDAPRSHRATHVHNNKGPGTCELYLKFCVLKRSSPLIPFVVRSYMADDSHYELMAHSEKYRSGFTTTYLAVGSCHVWSYGTRVGIKEHCKCKDHNSSWNFWHVDTFCGKDLRMSRSVQAFWYFSYIAMPSLSSCSSSTGLWYNCCYYQSYQLFLLSVQIKINYDLVQSKKHYREVSFVCLLAFI